MQSVYLETSVIGYLASRLSSDLVTAGNQRATHDWWTKHRSRYELFVSEPVILECSAGDSIAAMERMKFLTGIAELEVSELAESVADELVRSLTLPVKAHIDALHIAVAADTGMDYLLTWNCKHIANASLRRRIEIVLKRSNLLPPIICTPQELSDE